MFRKSSFATSAAVLALTALTGVSPASAAPPEGTPPALTTAAMNAIGYDQSVAEANGFQIVTYPDGNWESVAVTPTAKKIEAAYGGPTLIDPHGPVASKVTVYGNCGSSFIQVRSSASAWRADTGYSVKAPVANRINWTIQVASLGGIPSYTWPPSPTGAVWSGATTFATGGFGGTVFVTPGSSVLLINGTICGSGSPAESY